MALGSRLPALLEDYKTGRQCGRYFLATVGKLRPLGIDFEDPQLTGRFLDELLDGAIGGFVVMHQIVRTVPSQMFYTPEWFKRMERWLGESSLQPLVNLVPPRRAAS
jgi:predicted patatin/cPLA2 family phospholipase